MAEPTIILADDDGGIVECEPVARGTLFRVMLPMYEGDSDA